MSRTELTILSKNELGEIHQSALGILENTGVKVYNSEAMTLLSKAGAEVEGKKVFLPPSLVKNSINKAPKEFEIYARNTEHNVTMGKGEVNFEPMIGRVNVIDLKSGRKRKTTLEDVGNLIRLADALENYHILHSGAMMPQIKGVSEGTAHLHGYFQGVKNSAKIIKGSARGKRVAEECVEMASILAETSKEDLRDRPNIFTTCNVISPLRHDNGQTQGLMTYAKYGLPVDITSEPQLGSTSPVTLAGTLIQQTAEFLSGNVIAQLVNPGTPVWFGTCAGAMDMKNAQIALGGIEGALINIAHGQLSNYYGVPSRGTGCNTESKILDMQAGYEKAITLFYTALAGNNLIFYPGTMDHALSVDYKSLVIDNEICGMVKRTLDGISISGETKALEIIKEVGPEGHFLNKKHTLDNYENEFFLPEISNRDSREKWINEGSKETLERGREKAEQILREHDPDPLKKGVEMELKSYIKGKLN